MFIKLLATSIVANKRFGFRNNKITLFNSDSLVLSCNSSRDFNWSEKKATSAPEIIAEHKSNNNAIPSWIQTTFAIKKKELKKGKGSGSKYVVFKRVNLQHLELSPQHLKGQMRVELMLDLLLFLSKER